METSIKHVFYYFIFHLKSLRYNKIESETEDEDVGAEENK